MTGHHAEDITLNIRSSNKKSHITSFMSIPLKAQIGK